MENVTGTIHGVRITDPYRWLEDQDSPETRKWIEGQSAYTKSVLDKVPGRAKIAKRLAELLENDRMTPVMRKGGRQFIWKRQAKQNQAVLYVRDVKTGADTVLIDPNPMSPDGTVSASLLAVSEDGRLIAFALRNGGEDELAVKFRDLDTGRDLADELPRSHYWGIELSHDRSNVYYARYDANGPRLLVHKMGSKTPDEVIFGAGLGQETGIGCTLSDDGRYLVVTVSIGAADDNVDVYVKDVAKNGSIDPLVKGLNARFQPVPGGDTLFLVTNWKAPNGRVLSVPLANATQDNLKEIVAERQSALESAGTVGGKLVLNYLENAASKVRIHEPSGKLLREMTLPGIGTVVGPSGEWDHDEAYYGFLSFGQPLTWYSYSMSTGNEKVWFRAQTPVDPTKTEVTQVWVTSKDKTKIPMFLFHKKGLKPTADTPVLLYGYGGFNVNLTPAFEPELQVWTELGGVYAVPNLRGGGEFGEKWHQAGMLEKKQNVFDDFIASAEWLLEHGYGSGKTLSISGGSNGGLLTGAALTQRPELFGAVVCSVPLLDMVRYHQFKVAKLWVPEYGSSEDPKQFEYIYKYSPYHHVTKGAKYPAVMFVSGDSDTRVDPLHARKMAALLQASTGSDKPVLLHYDVKSGHAGGKPISKQIEDLTDELVFLASQLGVKLN